MLSKQWIPITNILKGKDRQVLARMAAIMRNWPDSELYPTLVLKLLRLPREFKKIRTVRHLSRLICAQYFYTRKMIKEVSRIAQRRHLFVKLLLTDLKFPFGSKPVVGLTVVFNLMRQREVFEEPHVIEAVQRIVPQAQLVSGSFVDHRDTKYQVHTVYLEIERELSSFTNDELKALKLRLPEELKGCVERLVPMTFMRRNEEEVYRNILALRDQLRSADDIPQATITFEEQTQFDLFFTVVLLRWVQGSESLVKELFEIHHPELVIIPDRVDLVGKLGKTHKKEASVFRIQLPKASFYRKDRSVNLYTARRHVLTLVMQAVGPVRDYNGGLILKQNERLEDFVTMMSSHFDEFMLENFFYSITPIAMQSILPAKLVKEWFLAFSEVMDREEEGSYQMLCRRSDEAHVIVIRSDDTSLKEHLLKEVNTLNIPSLELAFSEIKTNGLFLLGFLHRPSQVCEEKRLCDHLKRLMERWGRKRENVQSVHLALLESEPILDPRITRADQSYIILKMLFEGLTRIEPNGQPQLAIASSYHVSSDFCVYTFYLRESQWSNGTPITAFDFEYSWKKALQPGMRSIFSDNFYMIKHAKAAKRGELSTDHVGIHAIDEKTLMVELEYPVPFFLEVIAHWSFSLINSVIDQKHPGWAYQASENYVSNGPFRLLEWKHNRQIIVEKNPLYWDAEAVHLHRITIQMVEGRHSEMWLLEQGGVDIIGRPMSSFSTRKPAALPDHDLVSFPLSGLYVVHFNAAQFPFNHKKIRQAFALALDGSLFADMLGREYGGRAMSHLPAELSLHEGSLFSGRNVAAARTLFKEGLGEIGFVKSDFPKLTLSYCSGMHRDALFHALKRQWGEAFGIEVNVQSLGWSDHFHKMLTGQFDLAGIETRALWSDPMHLLEYYKNREDKLNFSNWEDPCYQKMLDDALSTKDLSKREEFMREAERCLAEAVPAVPLYQISGNYLKKKNLQGVYTSEFFQVDFKWAYKDV